MRQWYVMNPPPPPPHTHTHTHTQHTFLCLVLPREFHKHVLSHSACFALFFYCRLGRMRPLLNRTNCPQQRNRFCSLRTLKLSFPSWTERSTTCWTKQSLPNQSLKIRLKTRTPPPQRTAKLTAQKMQRRSFLPRAMMVRQIIFI